jgi:predicted hydrocarbon binding protein
MWWGKQFAKRHAAEVRQLYGTSADELPYHFFEQVLKRVWALHGWGTLDISFDLRSRGYVVLNVHNAIYSDVVGNIGKTSDHLVAGFVASIMSDIAARELSCVEIACRSKGDAKCSFVAGLGTRLEVVSAWVSQGRSRSDILAELAREPT